MGKANRVINILILVTAVVVMVFGIMLFAQREKLVGGWQSMADSISKSAGAIDKESGTKYAAALSAENLHHKKYDESKFSKDMQDFSKAVSALSEQKNNLSNVLAEAAAVNDIGEENDAAQLKRLDSTAARQEEIAAGFTKLAERDNNIFTAIATIADNMGAEVPTSQLKDFDTSADTFNKFETAVANTTKQRNDFEKTIASTASALAIQVPDLKGEKYPIALKTFDNAVQEYERAFQKTKTDLDTEKKTTASLRDNVAAKDKTIDAQLAAIKEKDAEIDRLQRIIDPTTGVLAGGGTLGGGTTIPTPTDNNLKYVKATIVDVNNKYGFVTIDLGPKYTFKRKVDKEGKFEETINVEVPFGEIMTIVRDFGTPEAKFAGKVQIVRVDDHASVANILPNPKPTVAPRVGDTVYFSSDDIRFIQEKKAAEQVVKAAEAETAKPEKEEVKPAAPAPFDVDNLDYDSLFN